MKNKVFIRALIASIFALVLYSANLHRVQNTKVKVVEPAKHKVAKKNKKEPKIKIKEPQAPKVSSGSEYASNVDIEKGSIKALANKIEEVMGKNGTYQVAYQDLNNSSKYVRLSTSEKAQNVSSTMELYLLVAIYKKEQSGKLSKSSAIKIKQSDRVKGEKLLQTNMNYGIAYLRDAMMKGNKTAANALLRKVGKDYVNQIAAKFGAKDTKLINSFSSSIVGQTTANDLDLTLKGLYQGRVLNRQYAYIVLGAMHGHKNTLTKQISEMSYGVSDGHSAAAIVQDRGNSYTISVWSNTDKNFSKLGKAISTWVNKH